MNMIHKPTNSSLSGSLQGELLEIKGMVDDICRTRSELCDVLAQMRTGHSRSNNIIVATADSQKIL